MCIAGHLRRVTWLFRGSGETRHDKARHNKSKETHQQPLPMAARDKIEAGQGDARSQQEAAKEPKCRLFGRKALANRPPQAAEEYRAEQGAGHQRSEEHTSELQSLRHLVCRLLLEKKKK